MMEMMKKLLKVETGKRKVGASGGEADPDHLLARIMNLEKVNDKQRDQIRGMEGMIQAFDSSLYELKTIPAKTKETDVLIDPVSWLDHLDGKVKELGTKLDNYMDNYMDKFKELERFTASIDSGLHNFEGKVRDHLAGIPENFAKPSSPALAPIEDLDEFQDEEDEPYIGIVGDPDEDDDEEDTKDNEIFQESKLPGTETIKGFNTYRYKG